MNQQEVILITGSSGYIGSALAKNLSSHYRVIGVDQHEPENRIDGVAYHTIDITSEKDVASTLAEIKKEHGPCLNSVIHLVAYYSFSGKADPKYQSITVVGTDALLTQLKKNFTVEQFIFSSTMLVYSPVKLGEKVKDDSPISPSWPYPASKIQTEKNLCEKHGDIPVVVLRVAGIYNDFCHAPSLANQIIRIHEGWMTSFLFPGNADHGQSFLHLEDLVDAVKGLIINRQKLKQFENFVVGEEEVLSYRELQKRIGDLTHQREWPVIKVPAFVAKAGAAVMQHLPFMREPFIKPWMIPHSDDHVDVNISKIKRLINWSPRRSLGQTLPLMIENLKKDPSTFYSVNKIDKPFYRPVYMIGSEREKNQWLAMVFALFLGLYLLGSPFTFGNLPTVEFWSQILSGTAVCVVALMTLFPTLRWMRWINASLGGWIMFSPLLFDVSSAAAYSSDTLIGALVILTSVYTPSTVYAENDKGIPPGWTYNPSTAGQRLPIMLLAFIGFLASRYLASYQLGHIDTVWDPVFVDGTRRVLESDVSKAFPVSDAGLGALTYLLDVIAAAMGGRQRWKTMPWAVILFGFMIIPAGVTSIALIMLQPISVGAWCTLCLVTAFVMLLMVPPAIDEVLASAQFLLRAKRQGKPFWKVFWLGSPDAETEEHLPVITPKGSLAHLVAATILGIWLMISPAVLNVEGIAANNIYIISSLIITFSIISFSEVARIARLINIPLAAWLIASPWIMGTMSEVAQWHSVGIGFLVILLSLPRGKKAERFGAWDKFIHWSPIKA